MGWWCPAGCVACPVGTLSGPCTLVSLPSTHPTMLFGAQEARRKLANAVVVGYLSHSDWQTHLNPPDSALLSRADKLIVLSHTVRCRWWCVPASGAVLRAPMLVCVCCLRSSITGLNSSVGLLCTACTGCSMTDHSPAATPLLPQTGPEMAPGGSTAVGLDVAALQQRLEAAQPPAPVPKSIVVVGWSGPWADLMVRRVGWLMGAVMKHSVLCLSRAGGRTNGHTHGVG